MRMKLNTPKRALSELTSSPTEHTEAFESSSRLTMKVEKQLELCVVYQLVVVDQAHSTSAVVALEPLQTMSALSCKKELNKIWEMRDAILCRFAEPIIHRSNASYLYIFSTQTRLEEPKDDNMSRAPVNGFHYMQL